MATVKTVPGGVTHMGPFTAAEYKEITSEQAEKVAADSNAKAKKLGIETRYEAQS